MKINKHRPLSLCLCLARNHTHTHTLTLTLTHVYMYMTNLDTLHGLLPILDDSSIISGDHPLVILAPFDRSHSVVVSLQ